MDRTGAKQVNVNNEFIVSVPIEEACEAVLGLEMIPVAAQGRDHIYVVSGDLSQGLSP
jgi:hypothetical protein